MHDGIAIALVVAMSLGAAMRYRFLRRQYAESFGRDAKERLRARWLKSVISQPPHYVLAVQTLRNSVMAASLIASAFAVLLVGVLSWREEINRVSVLLHAPAWAPLQGIKLALVVVVGLLAIINFLLAVRHYHQLGYAFVPDGSTSPADLRFASSLMLSATRCYGAGMRWALALFPMIGWLINPWIAVALSAAVFIAVLQAPRFPAATSE